MKNLKRVCLASTLLAVFICAVQLGCRFYQPKEVNAGTGEVVMLTPDNFPSVLLTGMPTLLLICSPDICNQMQPVLQDLQKRHDDKVKVVMLDAFANTDMWKSLYTLYSVKLGFIPPAFPMAIKLNQDGQPVAYSVGFLPVAELESLIENGVSLFTAPAAK